MLITHKSTFSASNVIVDTNSIASNCNSIEFDNYGDVDCKIYINDNVHTGSYIYLPAGRSKSLGGNIESYVTDVYDIVFVGDAAKGLNVIKEFYQIIT